MASSWLITGKIILIIQPARCWVSSTVFTVLATFVLYHSRNVDPSIMSSPLLTSCLHRPFIQDRYGRRAAMVAGDLVLFLGVGLQAGSQNFRSKLITLFCRGSRLVKLNFAQCLLRHVSLSASGALWPKMRLPFC